MKFFVEKNHREGMGFSVTYLLPPTTERERSVDNNARDWRVVGGGTTVS